MAGELIAVPSLTHTECSLENYYTLDIIKYSHLITLLTDVIHDKIG